MVIFTGYRLPVTAFILQNLIGNHFGQDGKGKRKDGKNKDGKSKDGKGKTKGKDGKDKAEHKSSSQNKDKKCFYCDKIGHVKAYCRKKKKKRDDKERKTTLAQNSLTSPSDATSPRALTNVPAGTSGTSTSSLRQLTVPSHVSDDEFHSPMRDLFFERRFAS